MRLPSTCVARLVRGGIDRSILFLAAFLTTHLSAQSGPTAYERRVESVRQTPGLVAFWDFVQREDGARGAGRFLAHTAPGDRHRYVLEPHNISREFWHEGAEATLADFPLLGRGPFGQAVQFREPKDITDLPVLMVPRRALHDTPLDIKGPENAVSMVVWLIHQSGDHAIAGMWHEGTDTSPLGAPALVRVRGQRQFGLFAGLAANRGAASAHISENGLASFGDRYARHHAVTPEKMKNAKPRATPAELDAGWSAVGFVFDHTTKTVTAYLNGAATEYWVDEPAKSPFYRSAERAWRQARLAAIPGVQPGEDPQFPRDQFYTPPETNSLKEEILSQSDDERVVVRTYAFTKVRVTLRKNAAGQFSTETAADLVALKANPYWFGHDIYAPPSAAEGGPFTIGRVIHSNRHATLSAFIGGVAVFNQPLSPAQMRALARLGTVATNTEPALLHLADVTPSKRSE